MRISKLYAALMIGIISISFAAVFIRLANIHPLAIAALRMIFAAVLLVPWAIRSEAFRTEIKKLAGGDFLLLLLSGFLLSMHFLSWITSLSLTKVTNSVVFVATTPFFIALYTILILKERVSRIFWAGLILAIFGGVILGGSDLFVEGERWKGDLLALAGAVAAAGYFLVGSRLRKNLSLISYIFPVYASAAFVLTILMLVFRVDILGFSWKSYLYCLLLALVCQVIGHSIFNWTLKHLRPTIVTIAVLGEPVGASLLALIILQEAPSTLEVIGGIFILSGVFIVLYFNPEATIGRTERVSR